MKLSKVIKVWELLHHKNTGELAYCDLENAVQAVEGVEDDVPGCPPGPNCRFHNTPAPIGNHQTGIFQHPFRSPSDW